VEQDAISHRLSLALDFDQMDPIEIELDSEAREERAADLISHQAGISRDQGMHFPGLVLPDADARRDHVVDLAELLFDRGEFLTIHDPSSPAPMRLGAAPLRDARDVAKRSPVVVLKAACLKSTG
jgi:hypothetical protein